MDIRPRICSLDYGEELVTRSEQKMRLPGQKLTANGKQRGRADSSPDLRDDIPSEIREFAKRCTAQTRSVWSQTSDEDV